MRNRHQLHFVVGVLLLSVACSGVAVLLAFPDEEGVRLPVMFLMSLSGFAGISELRTAAAMFGAEGASTSSAPGPVASTDQHDDDERLLRDGSEPKESHSREG